MQISEDFSSRYCNWHELPLQHESIAFLQWNEAAEKCLFLSPSEQETENNDDQYAKILIGRMACFFEKYCKNTIANYSILSKEPLCYEACKLALWIFKNFNAMIVFIEDPERELEFTIDSNSKFPYQLSVIEISKKSLNALIRHTQELKLRDETSKFLQVSCLGMCIQSQAKEIPTEDKGCFAHCTLF